MFNEDSKTNTIKELAVKLENCKLNDIDYTVISIYNKETGEILHERLHQSFSKNKQLERLCAECWCKGFFEENRNKNETQTQS